jgi:putative Ca2+/H+ antiporter (TMEM165/GDT1 family)
MAVKLVSAALFAFGAVVLLRGGDDDEEGAVKTVTGFWPVYTTAFMAVFISEWGDLTQITTANLAATNPWLPTALGSALALMSVSALALLVGRFIAKRVPLKTVQRIGAACMAGLAVWTLIEAFTA